MKRKFKITTKQLNELFNSDSVMSNETTPEFSDATISTTEPMSDKLYGKPETGDDKARMMPPGILQRITTRGAYGGPIV